MNIELSFTKPVVRDLGAHSDTGKRSIKREKGKDFCTQQERPCLPLLLLWQQDQQIKEGLGKFMDSGSIYRH